jgi:DNA-directed RNA polymerase beta subunit
MASIQSCHIIPTVKQHSYLVGTGIDKSLAYTVGSDYAFKSQDEGVITKIDKEHSLVFIKYKDGTKGVINLISRMAKNEGGGFYLNVKLDLVDGLKVGSKFKKGEILAFDRNYFKKGREESNYNFAIGRLTRVAITSLGETFEDSSIISEKFRKDMTTEIISLRDVALKENTKLIKIASIGDVVSTSDPLIIYEEVNDTDGVSLDILDKLEGKNKDDLHDLARNTIKAKYSGEIVDIKILYNSKLEDMHPTLRKYIQNYIDVNTNKSKLLKDISPTQIIEQPSTDRIDNTKLLGSEIQGCLIQFFIKHYDDCAVGDKISFYTSAKTIICDIFPEGKTPITAKNDEIEAILSPMSIVSRMTMDMFLMGYTNKILLELKRQVIEDLEL